MEKMTLAETHGAFYNVPSEVIVKILDYCSTSEIINFIYNSRSLAQACSPLLHNIFIPRYPRFPFSAFARIDKRLPVSDKWWENRIVALLLDGELDRERVKKELSFCLSLKDLKIAPWYIENKQFPAKSLPGLEKSQIQKLDLSECKEITDEELIALAEKCPELAEVCLNDCEKLTDRGLTVLAEKCPKLVTIHLDSCNITDKGLAVLAEKCPGLVSVRLGNCVQITDNGLKALAAKCSGLKEIDLEGCNIGDKGLIALGQGCIHLVKIDLTECEYVTDKELKALAETCSHISEIHLEGCSIKGEGLADFAGNFADLEILDLADTVITDSGLKILAGKCPRLVAIYLSSCEEITDEGLGSLAEKCPGLKVVNLNFCMQITDTGFIALAEKCPDLEEISFSRCNIGDKALVRFSFRCRKLQAVNLNYCKSISADSVSALALNCPRLITIILQGCDGISPMELTNCGGEHPRIESIQKLLNQSAQTITHSAI